MIKVYKRVEAIIGEYSKAVDKSKLKLIEELKPLLKNVDYNFKIQKLKLIEVDKSLYKSWSHYQKIWRKWE